jgi:hypothetical protein
MKNKPLTKKQRKDLIDAWAGMNSLCAYLKDYKTKPENFGVKFDPHSYAKDIYELLDSVIKNVDDSDLCE